MTKVSHTPNLNDDETNLITDQQATRIEGLSLKANKKDSSIYHVSVIENNSQEDDDDVINIMIETLQE